MKMPRIVAAFGMILVTAIAGCLPSFEPPPVVGYLTHVDGFKVFSRGRRINGPRHVAELRLGEKPFQANWETGMLIEKTAQLQIKPPVDQFSAAELCLALQLALEDRDSNPWHRKCDDTILRAFRRAWLSGEGESVFDTPPEAPYEFAVRVKQNGPEWFCQVQGALLPDPSEIPIGLLD